MVKGVQYMAKGVRGRVRGLDHKIGSVFKGDLFFHRPVPESVLSFYPLRCNGDRISYSTGV